MKSHRAEANFPEVGAPTSVEPLLRKFDGVERVLLRGEINARCCPGGTIVIDDDAAGAADFRRGRRSRYYAVGHRHHATARPNTVSSDAPEEEVGAADAADVLVEKLRDRATSSRSVCGNLKDRSGSGQETGATEVQTIQPRTRVPGGTSATHIHVSGGWSGEVIVIEISVVKGNAGTTGTTLSDVDPSHFEQRGCASLHNGRAGRIIGSYREYRTAGCVKGRRIKHARVESPGRSYLNRRHCSWIVYVHDVHTRVTRAHKRVPGGGIENRATKNRIQVDGFGPGSPGQSRRTVEDSGDFVKAAIVDANVHRV